MRLTSSGRAYIHVRDCALTHIHQTNVLITSTAGMLTTIDERSASQLPEKTERLPLHGREEDYVVTLDVFHQMHCLDVVRMSLYRDRYDKHFYFPNGTVDYCKWLHVGTFLQPHACIHWHDC
jgi:hypothetical protein